MEHQHILTTSPSISVDPGSIRVKTTIVICIAEPIEVVIISNNYPDVVYHIYVDDVMVIPDCVLTLDMRGPPTDGDHYGI